MRWVKHGKWVGLSCGWEEGSSCVWEQFSGKGSHCSLTVPTIGIGWSVDVEPGNMDDWLYYTILYQGVWYLQGRKVLEPIPHIYQGMTVLLEKITSYPCSIPWKIVMTIFRRKAVEIFQAITIRKFIFQGRYSDWESSLSRKQNLVFLSEFLVYFILDALCQWFLQFRCMKKKNSLFFDIEFFKNVK